MQYCLHLLRVLNANIGISPRAACVDCEHDQGMRGSLIHTYYHEIARRKVYPTLGQVVLGLSCCVFGCNETKDRQGNEKDMGVPRQILAPQA